MENKAFKRARGFASSVVAMFVADTKNESKGIYMYGKDNLLPNTLIKTIAQSGVATRAVGKVAEYIASDGFTDKATAVFKVNSKQTADEILNEVAGYIGFLPAVALHVSYTGGVATEVKCLPIQCIRKKIDGGFIFNKTYGQPKVDETESKHYPSFVNNELSNDEILSGKFANGSILYAYKKTVYNSYYPIPDYYAQIEDVQTSGEISKMDLELALNGFMPSCMITAIGDYDSETKDATTGLTEVEQLIQDCQVFTGKNKNDSGLSTRFSAFLNFAKTKEEVPVLQTFDLKSILESSNTKRDIIERAVCRLWGIHPVLMGYSDAAILGNTQALANASMELNKVVNQYQRMISEAFKKVFPAFNWDISEYTPINFIDPALYDKMTEDEIRNKLLGLPPKETDATAEGDKVIKAINSLSPLVANKVLESLTPDEIRALIGLGAQIKTTPDATVN